MVAFNPFIIVPLYLYPSSGAWQPLYNQASSHPSVAFQVIINPNSGPGVSPGQYPDSNWITAISTLNKYSNVQTIGYVPTNYAERNITLVEQDVATYADWAAYGASDIHLDGIFFDEAPDSTDSTTLAYMDSIASYARAEFPDQTGRVVTFNPGAPVSSEYYDIADSIIAFESDFSDFSYSPSGYPFADIASQYLPQSTFMINNFPNGPKAQKKLVNTLVSRNITGIWISTNDDYSEFSALWSNVVSQVTAVL